MRNIRRTLALILALVMALSVSAFAADSGAGDDTGMGDCCEAGTCTMPCCADDGEETEAPPACTCGGTGLEAASVAAEVEPDASGTIGQSALTWTLRNGILTIGGTGSVAPFASRDDQPWAEVREEISQVWFDDMEAVSIPDLAYWFTDCVNLTTEELPKTTPVIGTDAFAGCASLDTVLLYYDEDDPLTIAEGAFRVDAFDEDRILTLASACVHEALLDYPWTEDNRQAAIVDVYGVMGYSSITCGGCNCWTGRTDCIVDNPKYDDYDKYCGCPYDKDDGDGGGGGGGGNTCSHTSTYTDWDGCAWREYCYRCGDLVDSGVTHSTYTYGEWEYYTEYLHRRTETCDRCGEIRYSSEEHVQAERYEKYSASQHTVTAYCSVCGGDLDSGVRESHSFTYGSWSSYSSSQHRRTQTCSLCGYSTYTYGSHTDGNGDGRCDVCSYGMSVTVTWDASTNGGTVNGQGSVTTSVTSGSKAAAPGASPVKTGHSFRGWYTDPSGGSLYDTVTITAARTFYAQFEADSYAVTWDLGDGDRETTSQTYGQALVLPDTPSKTGHTFIGWFTAESGGTQVTDSTVYTTAGPATYYARWEAQKYTITWDLGDGRTETTSQTYGEKLVLPTQPLKDGYTFLGWFTAESGGTQVTGDEIYTGTGPATYYAHWELLPVFSVTVPMSLALTVSERGEVYAATGAAIVNHSTAPVRVSEVTVSAVNGWTLVPYDTDMAGEKVDSRLLGFALNGAETSARGGSEALALTGDWTIPLDGSLPLTYDAVVSALSQPVDERVVSIVFVLEWA